MEAITSRFHQVVADTNDPDFLYLTVDQRRYRIRWSECSKRLATASTEQRAQLDVSPTGYGIHWPLIDEDLAIASLMRQAEDLGASNEL